MLGEEDLIDNFAKIQFIHANPTSARAALIRAVEIHREMQSKNPQYRGRAENMDLAWCLAELSVLEESDGNGEIAKSYRAEAESILSGSGAKDTTVTHLMEVLHETQAQASQDTASSGGKR